MTVGGVEIEYTAELGVTVVAHVAAQHLAGAPIEDDKTAVLEISQLYRKNKWSYVPDTQNKWSYVPDTRPRYPKSASQPVR